ncbi:MAG: hypothetical protein WCW87_00920 [Candidatus Paceibacterota bacterium]
MGYRPTLGGLKKAQEFLSLNGFPLPFFRIHIYNDSKHEVAEPLPIKGTTVSIDEMIRKYGPLQKVVDVRLSNEKGDKAVLFIRIDRAGLKIGKNEKKKDLDAVPKFWYGDPVDDQFKNFMCSVNGDLFLNIAQWGKSMPTMFELFKFRFFPKRYATKVFA